MCKDILPAAAKLGLELCESDAESPYLSRGKGTQGLLVTKALKHSQETLRQCGSILGHFQANSAAHTFVLFLCK